MFVVGVLFPITTHASRDVLCNCRETVMAITGRTDIPDYYTGVSPQIHASAPHKGDIIIEYVPQVRAHVALAVTEVDKEGNFWVIEGGTCQLQARIINIYQMSYAGVWR